MVGYPGVRGLTMALYTYLVRGRAEFEFLLVIVVFSVTETFMSDLG